MEKDEIRRKIDKLKLTLALGGALAPQPSSASVPDKEPDVHVVYYETRKTSDLVIDNHDNQYWNQMREAAFSVNGQKISSSYKSAALNRYDLGDGYTFVATEVNKHTDSKKKRELKEYIAAPDGKTYDCSFLHGRKWDMMPAALSGQTFADNFSDKKLAAALETQIKETLGVKKCDNQAVAEYNALMVEKKLQEAVKRGYPQDVVGKIGVYMQKMRQVMEGHRIYVGAVVQNETSDYTKETTLNGAQQEVNGRLNQLIKDRLNRSK